MPLEFKLFINSIWEFVIVVGTVDNVDISAETVYVDRRAAVSLPDVGLAHEPDQASLWRDSGQSIHRLIHKNSSFSVKSISWKSSLEPVHIWGCFIQEICPG